MAIPLLALVFVAVTTLVVTGTGHKMDVLIAGPGAGLGILLTASQLLTHRDSLVARAIAPRAQGGKANAIVNQMRGFRLDLNRSVGTPDGFCDCQDPEPALMPGHAEGILLGGEFS